MNENPSQHDLSSMALSDAALIRIAADGEQDLLSADQRARLSELEASAEVRSQIEAEQSLRASLVRTYAGTAAPAGLRERLQAKLADADASVPEQLAEQTSQPSFWRKTVATLAVAAAVAITGISIFQGGQVNPNGTQVAGLGISTEILAARQAAAKFVSSEHDKCVMDLGRALAKSRVVEAEQLPEAVSGVLDRSARIEDLIFTGNPGVSFEWAGPCGVPGAPSMHLSFESPDHGGNVSLFIQPDREDLGLKADTTYTFGSACDDEGPAVYVWSREGFVYYLVAAEAPGCDTLLKDQQAPESLSPLTRAPEAE